MDNVAHDTSLINAVKRAYSEIAFQQELQSTLNSIKARMSTIIDQYADNYNLTFQNDIRPIKYYSVIGRVKEPDSFHEKLIRGNLIYEILNDLNYNSASQINRHQNRVRESIRNKADDIIGIKILTEVEDDCQQILKLINDKYSSDFNDSSGIMLDEQDIKKQPIKMRNGMSFYKIKGTFMGNHKFELQIKGKLMSVWGDMDHAIFYKDYSASPVKENARDLMINLGNLIGQVDKILLKIREANNTFSKNREVIDFTEKFSNNYSQLIKGKLGYGYRIDDFSEFLYYLYKEVSIDDLDLIKTEFNYEHFSFDSDYIVIDNYIALRKSNFNLQIIELVYFNWFYFGRISRSKYSECLLSLLYDYRDFIKTAISHDYLVKLIDANFLTIVNNLNHGNCLFDLSKYIQFASVYKLIEPSFDFDLNDNEIDNNKKRTILLYSYYSFS